MNYDPNLMSSGEMARQTIKLTFGVWTARLEATVTIEGNVGGLSAMEAAVSKYFDTLPQKTYKRHRWAFIILIYPNGDTLECEDDDDQGIDWLKEMLIGAEITAIEPQ